MSSISIVLPVHNEEDNLIPLYEEILQAIKEKVPYEILFVDDGSTDKSVEIVNDLASRDQYVKLIQFRRNFGQTAAMAAGIDHASNEVIILMDADRQNDPADIPLFLEKLTPDVDVVVGWRKNRKDKAINRKLPSKIANWLIRRIGGVKVNDLGCSLKAFRRDLIQQVRLYGEMHRFIPLYTTAIGGKIEEVVTNHRPRVAGVTKYGINRTFKVLLDLITVKFLMTYATKPMYFFGFNGLLLFGLSFISSLFLVIHKVAHGISIIQSPLLILTAVLFILAVNFILLGLIAEIQMRIYFECQDKPSYYVRNKTNLG